MIKEIPKKYNSKITEKKWMEEWTKNNIYKFEKDNINKPIYTIDSPPPTVSGRLHIGHLYGAAIMDFVARYKRLKGYNVLLPFGTDDNGLPSQRLIEKIKNVKSQKMLRKDFVKLCNDTLNNELKPNYLQDFKNLGISADWTITYSTIDKNSRQISQKSFIELYKQNRAYRQEAPTMWCPTCQTAISQAELEDQKVESIFNDIIFKRINEKGKEEKLVVATTRPELLPACVAIFYNPKDERYKHLKGKKAIVPLFNYQVPILEDNKADIEKGTGLVMCCTFGDQTDVEWQKLYNLPIKQAITKDGKMTELAKEYKGLTIKEARNKIIEDMKKQNLLINQKPIIHELNTHERCGTPIEFIHSKQWFIKYLDIKDKMLNWGNEFNWYPNLFKNIYNNWVNGLGWDWCISRQIHFGIPFPIWYCKNCDEIIFANENELPIDPESDKPPIDKCPKCQETEFIPEKDIINTWATSSMTPTIVKEQLKGHKTYDLIVNKPMDLRTQGKDIISFWLFNTIVKSKLHYNLIPWKNVIITGWILDSNGKKMSKSKNNIISLNNITEKYSADAYRYMSGTFKLGYDAAYPEKEVVTGQKLVVKLFNSTKFALMHLKDYEVNKKPEKLEKIDIWVLTKLNQTIKNTDKYLKEFSFSKALAELNSFFWKDLCDNYLEIIKDRLYNPDKRGENARISAQYVLFNIFNSILKMYSVYMPFITEELYSWYFKEYNKSYIGLSNWPEEIEINQKIDLETAEEILKIITHTRTFKSKENISLKTELEKIQVESTKDYTGFIEDLKAVTKAKKIETVKNIENPIIYEDNLKLNIKKCLDN
jgi:valyl-tRNA synthetase